MSNLTAHNNFQAAKRKVLIVEDSLATVEVLSKRLEADLDVDFEVATTFAEAKKLLAKDALRFFVAIVDLHLPDAEKGEVVDFVISEGVPPIILSSSYHEEVRAMMMDKAVVDYVVKRNHQELCYLMSVVKRVKENVHRKVLVVDDSPSCRIVLSRYLSRQNLQVLEAKSAEEALEIIKREQDIFLIITDQNMGGMKGSDMIGEIRVNYARTDLAIIGISASNDKRLNALFLKSGANDFFAKPFSYEELFCRVTQNIDSVVLNKILADSASLDSISGTSNASHLMRMGNFFHHNLLRDNIDYAIICLQLLGFEELTSEHGLEVGEELLKHAGSQLMNVTRQSDAVARVSHSEFCLLCIGVEPATEKTVLTRVIDSIEKTPLVYEGVTHHLKLATHLSYPVAADFSTDLKEARQALKRMQSR